MFLTDTHCHLDKEYYLDGLDAVFKNALDNDVKRVLFVGSLNYSGESVRVANGENALEVWAGVGVHPHEAASMPDGIIPEIRQLAADKKVVAVGEIGLDYFYDISPRDIQRKVFREQIEFAREIKKPVVVHVRDAKEKSDGDANADNIRILREAHAEDCGGVIHCFSGNEQDAYNALDLGFYISFAGPLTFKRNTELREIAAKLPLDRLLCETDSPYLAPEPFRGRTNEPCHVKQVYELLAMLREMTIEELSEKIDENGCRLFGWGSENV